MYRKDKVIGMMLYTFGKVFFHLKIFFSLFGYPVSFLETGFFNTLQNKNFIAVIVFYLYKGRDNWGVNIYKPIITITKDKLL